MPDQSPPRDGLTVMVYAQDADSFGWSILALFYANYEYKRPRWGVLVCLTGTENGADSPTDQPDVTYGSDTEVAEVVRRHWHLVDWYKTEQEARDAFKEAESRRW